MNDKRIITNYMLPSFLFHIFDNTTNDNKRKISNFVVMFFTSHYKAIRVWV